VAGAAPGDRRRADAAALARAFAVRAGLRYWQAYQHFRLLGDQLARVGGAGKVDPLSATLGVVLWSITFLHYSTEPLFVLLDAIELSAAIGVVVYGQRALNEYWRARPGAAVPERLVDTDLLALAIAASYFAIAILGYVSGPGN